MTWKRDLQHAHENMLRPIDCIQSVSSLPVNLRAALILKSGDNIVIASDPAANAQAEDLMQARLRALHLASPGRWKSPSVGNAFMAADVPGASDRASPSANVHFDDIRPKTAGSPARIGANLPSRPQTARTHEQGAIRRNPRK